jgi:hypothetical protein
MWTLLIAIRARSGILLGIMIITTTILLYPKHLLAGDRFRVEVRLRGVLIEETFSFTFKTTDKGFEIE